jgi:hypothetical protein
MPNRLLYEASKAGNTDEVNRLIEQNPNINVNWHNDDNSILGVASLGGHEEVVRVLLRHPLIFVNQEVNSKTAFSIACVHRNIPVIRALLEDDRVNANLPRVGKTPLSIASKNGDTEIVELILSLGKDLLVDKKTVDDVPEHVRPLFENYKAGVDQYSVYFDEAYEEILEGELLKTLVGTSEKFDKEGAARPCLLLNKSLEGYEDDLVVLCVQYPGILHDNLLWPTATNHFFKRNEEE